MTIRFDHINRSERYYTSTLLPAVLFHGNLRGLRGFVDLVSRECSPRPSVAPDFTDPEISTELHIARDLDFAVRRGEAQVADTGDTDGRRDAPDLVLILGSLMIVVEAKFFSTINETLLRDQLTSQREQVRRIEQARPEINEVVHVALLPKSIDLIDLQGACRGVITWDQIAELADKVMGSSHYVAKVLRQAVTRYSQLGTSGNSSVPNFDDVVNLESALELCRAIGASLEVGFVGGIGVLNNTPVSTLKARQWKLRDPEVNKGKVNERNWISGDEFVRVVSKKMSDDQPGD